MSKIYEEDVEHRRVKFFIDFMDDTKPNKNN